MPGEGVPTSQKELGPMRKEIRDRISYEVEDKSTVEVSDTTERIFIQNEKESATHLRRPGVMLERNRLVVKESSRGTAATDTYFVVIGRWEQEFRAKHVRGQRGLGGVALIIYEALEQSGYQDNQRVTADSVMEFVNIMAEYARREKATIDQKEQAKIRNEAIDAKEKYCREHWGDGRA